MKVVYKLYQKSNNEFRDIELEEVSSCPLCHCSGHPHFEGGYVIGKYDEQVGSYAFVILYCTICKTHYIAKYNIGSHGRVLEYTLPSHPRPEIFDKIIQDLSPSFATIYNQSKQTEEYGLSELVGIGYRKSLEFLIKDYLIHKQNENADEIKSLFLGECIKKIKDEKLETLATGATWIGNDETHYERRNKDYGVEHLKLFIKALVSFIVSNETYNEALKLVNSKNS